MSAHKHTSLFIAFAAAAIAQAAWVQPAQAQQAFANPPGTTSEMPAHGVSVFPGQAPGGVTTPGNEAAEAAALAAGAGRYGQGGQGAAVALGKSVTPGTGVSGSGAPTASEQGLVSEGDRALASYQAEQQALASTPRQQGITVPVSGPIDPVAGNPADAGWVANWSYALERAGVPAWKVDFEAARLDREAFGQWAWREIQVDWQAPTRAWTTPAPGSVAQAAPAGRDSERRGRHDKAD